jgi:hypothetical protein
LSWRLAALGNAGGSTVHVAPADMLTAAREVVLALMPFAVAAALASALPRSRGR